MFRSKPFRAYKFRCTNCGHSWLAINPETLIGKKYKCPSCFNYFEYTEENVEKAVSPVYSLICDYIVRFLKKYFSVPVYKNQCFFKKIKNIIKK